MRRYFPCLFLTLLLMGLGAGAALADTAREEAGKHVVRGDGLKQRAEAAQKAGDSEDASRLFERAAEEYRAAYDLVPHPLMLYNLAQVYRLAGKHEEALEMYQGFLASDPSGEAAEFARKYVRILEKLIEKDEPDDPDVEPDDPDVEVDPKPDSSIEKTGGSDAGKKLQYGGLATAAVGLISLGVGVKYGIDARDMATCLGSNYPAGCQEFIPADVLAQGGWSDEADKLEKKTLPSTRNKMYIFGGLGAAAIVAGGVMYFLGEKEAEEGKASQTLRIEPQLQENEVGLALSGRF